MASWAYRSIAVTPIAFSFSLGPSPILATKTASQSLIVCKIIAIAAWLEELPKQ